MTSPKAPDRCLTYIGRKRGADVVESGVETTSKGLHAGSCAERDQGNVLSILKQFLTFFAETQVLDLHVQLENCVFHLRYSSLGIDRV